MSCSWALFYAVWLFCNSPIFNFVTGFFNSISLNNATSVNRTSISFHTGNSAGCGIGVGVLSIHPNIFFDCSTVLCLNMSEFYILIITGSALFILTNMTVNSSVVTCWNYLKIMTRCRNCNIRVDNSIAIIAVHILQSCFRASCRLFNIDVCMLVFASVKRSKLVLLFFGKSFGSWARIAMNGELLIALDSRIIKRIAHSSRNT